MTLEQVLTIVNRNLAWSLVGPSFQRVVRLSTCEAG